MWLSKSSNFLGFYCSRGAVDQNQNNTSLMYSNKFPYNMNISQSKYL